MKCGSLSPHLWNPGRHGRPLVPPTQRELVVLAARPPGRASRRGDRRSRRLCTGRGDHDRTVLQGAAVSHAELAPHANIRS